MCYHVLLYCVHVLVAVIIYYCYRMVTPKVNDSLVIKKTAEKVITGLKPESVFHLSDHLSKVCADLRKVMKQR